MRKSLLLGAQNLICVLALSACGTTYNVEPVENLYETANGEGIAFYLPKTEVTAEVVFTSTHTVYGRDSGANVKLKGLKIDTAQACSVLGGSFLKGDCADQVTLHDIYKHNLRACGITADPGGTIILLKEQSYKSEIKVVPTEFSFYARSIADQSKLYRLNIATDLFASYSHTINLNERGIITSGSSVVKDGASPALLAALKGVTTFISPALPTAGGGDPVEMRSDEENTQCTQLKDSYSLQTKLVSIEKEKREFLTDNEADISEAFAKLAISAIDEQKKVAVANDPRASARSKVTKKSKSIVATRTITPAEFLADQEFSPDSDRWEFYPVKLEPKKDDKKTKRLSLAKGELHTHFGFKKPENDVLAKINKYKIVVSSSTNLDPDPQDPGPPTRPHPIRNNVRLDNTNGTSTAIRSKHGYPYRLATQATVTLEDTTDSTSKKLAEADLAVAQLSPIFYLPRSFDGSQGTLDITYFADTGSASMIKIGSEPVLADTVSGVFGAVNSYRTARATEEARKAAVAKAEAEQAELDAATALTAPIEDINRDTAFHEAMLANLQAREALEEYLAGDVDGTEGDTGDEGN